MPIRQTIIDKVITMYYTSWALVRPRRWRGDVTSDCGADRRGMSERTVFSMRIVLVQPCHALKGFCYTSASLGVEPDKYILGTRLHTRMYSSPSLHCAKMYSANEFWKPP